MNKNKTPSLNFKINNIQSYNEEKTIGDLRFTKVKITLMHTGLNYNYSIFTKKSIEEAIPTLANIPILGYLKYNSDGTKDFKAHEWEIIYTSDKTETKYIGSAYGVIPENNNAHFEKIIDEYGVEREYLIVDGLIWNRYDDVVNILNRDIFKSQSIELSDDYIGKYNDDFQFVFEKFQFNGACFLGEEYEPAMVGANITTKFSKENNDKIIKYVSNNLKQYMAKNREGVKQMSNNDKNNNEDLLKQYSTKIKELEEQLKNYSKKENDEKINNLEGQIENYSKDIENKNNEIISLKGKIEKIELQEKNKIIEEYSEKLNGIEEYDNLKKDETKIKSYSINETKDVLNRIFGENLINGKITNFSKNEEDKNANIYFSKENKDSKNNERYGNFF